MKKEKKLDVRNMRLVLRDGGQDVSATIIFSKKDNINDVSEEKLMEVIIFHCMDELEFGEWEEPADVIYDLGVNAKEAEEIMSQIPDYFGDDEGFEE